MAFPGHVVQVVWRRSVMPVASITMAGSLLPVGFQCRPAQGLLMQKGDERGKQAEGRE